jgi:HEAT repeats
LHRLTAPILACFAAACASPPLSVEPTGASADPAAAYLTEVIGTHGWPCDAVTDFQETAPQWTSVTCRDGNTYEIFLRDGWNWRAEQRQTRLQPLLEIGQWTERLTGGDVADRQRAAAALGGLGAEASPAVPALADALSDEDPGVRQSAAEALGRIGPDASPALPALTQALADPDAGVRENAALAVAAIRGE